MKANNQNGWIFQIEKKKPHNLEIPLLNMLIG